MIQEELYINGQKADLSGRTGINLNFQSNLFNDLGKIQASRSWTIKLPKTATNNRIFELSGEPGNHTTFPYRKHKGSYFRNGIEIVREGTVILQNISEDYEILLYWGLPDKYIEWAQSSLTLQDVVQGWGGLLQYSQAVLWSNQIDPYNSAYYQCSHYNHTTSDTIGHYPSVRLSWFLDPNSDANIFPKGVKYEFPESIKETLHHTMLPLVTGKDIYGVRTEFKAASLSPNTGGPSFEFKALAQDTFYLGNGIPLTSGKNQNYHGIRINAYYLEFQKIEFNLSIEGEMREIYDELSIAVMNGNKEILTIKGKVNSLSGWLPGFYIKFSIKFDEIRTNIKNVGTRGDLLTFKFINAEHISNCKVQGTVEITPTVSELFSTGNEMLFPIVTNLPPIKQVDLVKTVCAMFCLFPIINPNEPDTIKFVSLEDIMNKASATDDPSNVKEERKDWSNKLAPAKDGQSFNISHTFMDFARNNELAYKEEEYQYWSDENLKNKGIIKVNNENLVEYKNLYTFPFAASSWVIPIFENLRLVKLEPRIMYEYNNGGKSYLRFDELHIDNLIKKYYKAYTSVIQNPVVINERFRLTDVDLKELEFDVPIYLRQYGHYYALLKVQVKDSGFCDCQLLQLL